MTKEQIACMVLLLTMGNILTYNSFKYYFKKSGSTIAPIENSLLYPLVNSYIGLYAIILSYVGKWIVKIATLSLGESPNFKFMDSLLKSSIIFTFKTMMYSTSMFVLIGLLTYIFKMHIAFNSKGKYSMGFQGVVFLINVALLLIATKYDLNLTDETIIRSFIIMVTLLSLIKTNIKYDNSSMVDRWSSGFTNFFLNFNFKLLVIFSPFVIFGLLGYMIATETPAEKMTLYAGIGVMIIMSFILIAIVNAKIEKHKRESESGRKANKGFMVALAPFKEAASVVLNPAVLKSIFKWATYVVIYSIPLVLYIKFTSDDFEIFKKKYFATFNQRFAVMIGCAYASMSILHKYIKLDPASIERLMSLIIASSLIMSQRKS